MPAAKPVEAPSQALWAAVAIAVLCVLAAPGAALVLTPPVADDLIDARYAWDETRRFPATGPTQVLDLTGTPEDETFPSIAFRIHGDIAAAEGTLLPPTEPDESPAPVFNTGLRFHAITFDPPLVLEDGTNLTRIHPGPLRWSPAQGPTDLPRGEGLRYRVTAQVPPPAADGVTPANTTNETTGIWLDLTWDVHATRGTDETGAMISPADLRARNTLHVPATALHPDHDASNTTIRWAYHFDFGAAGEGVVRPDAMQGALAGAYLRRGDFYAHLRHIAAPETIPGATPAEYNFTYRSHPEFPQPRMTKGNVFSPITTNATGALVEVAATQPDEEATYWSTIDVRLGYERAFIPPPAPTATDPGRDTPAPGLVLFLVGALVVAAMGHARRRRGLPWDVARCRRAGP